MANQVDPARLAAACDAVGLDPEATAALLVPAVRVVAEETGVPVGASKLGGLPDLPADWPWPLWDMRSYERRELDEAERWLVRSPDESLRERVAEQRARHPQGKVPLSLCVQLDLRDLKGLPHGLPLPESGHLYFFDDLAEQPWGYCPSHRGSFRVLHVPEGVPLERRERPAALAAEHVLTEARARFEPTATLPGWAPGGADGDAYLDLLENLESWPPIPPHQIGGLPDGSLSEMQRACALVSQGIYLGSPPEGIPAETLARKAASAKEWRLLVQLGSDDAFDWMWGDLGNLSWWMRERDIREGVWDRAWFQLQSG